MLCILCLSVSEQVIHIFEEQGKNLNVSSIIIKHFWLEPDSKDVNAKVICSTCWDALVAFHRFYEKVQLLHKNYFSKHSNSAAELKEEEQSDLDNFEEVTELLATDIKLEVKCDGMITLSPCDPVSDEADQRETQDVADSDSDLEIPLAILANRKRTAVLDGTLSEEILIPSSTSDKNEIKKTKSKAKTSQAVKQQIDKPKDKRSSQKKKRTKPQNKPKLQSEGEENRVKRKVIDPLKKRQMSKEFDKVIQQNIKLSCSICYVPLANFLLLKKHYQSEHNVRGYATCCGRKFAKRGVLVDHIHLHLNPEFFKCNKCERIMADRRSLEVHMVTHDTSKQRVYQCNECEKSFFRKLMLDRHMYTHIPERKFTCETCGKLFSSEYTLRQHRNNVHNGAYMKICEHCGKSIRSLEAFRRHQLEHAGMPIPLVECKKCGVKLTNKYGLKRHMESMHPDTKVSHVCKECGKVSPSAAALLRHMSYMHRCERNHKCPMCDKAFKKAAGLKVRKFPTEYSSTNKINAHFLKPSAENANNKVICYSCWNELESFHKFYQKVDEAHTNLINSWSSATVESSDILSTAIHMAGIRQESDEDTEEMEVTSSEESDFEESYITKDIKSEVKRTSSTEEDSIIKQHMKLKCNACQAPMKNFYMLKVHFETIHHEEGYVTCCKLRFKKRSALAEHIYLDHGFAYLYDKCDQPIPDSSTLNLNTATTVTVLFEQTVQTCNAE